MKVWKQQPSSVAVVAALTLTLTGVGVVFGVPAQAAGPLTAVSKQTSGKTATQLAEALVGAGVTVSNVTYTGDDLAIGEFTGGGTLSSSPVGFESGIVMSSGDVSVIDGVNGDDGTTGDLAATVPGDADLDAIIAPSTTNDASVLTFDFVPTKTPLTFSYVFGSEEYNEFVNSFNDVFAFFVNGVNCAKVPGSGDIVSVDNVNLDKNSTYYRNNDPSDLGTPTPIDNELDGLTTVLTCEVAVNIGVTNTMKFAIADAGDTVLDSAVFLAADSFTVETPNPTTTTYGGGASVQYSDPLAVSGTLLDISSLPGVPVPSKSLGFTLGAQSTSATTNASGVASGSITVNQVPGPYSMLTAFAGDADFTASSDTDAVTVAKEDCTLALSAPLTVPAGSAVNVQATLDEGDATKGDRSGKAVAFTFTDAALTSTVANGVTGAGGVATASATLAPGAYSVTAAFSGDAYYLPCASGESMVTVEASVAQGAKVTGGGFIVSQGRTSFGFNAQSVNGALFGQLQVRSGKAKFHGSAVTSLTVNGKTATWSGTGRWNGVGGYTFTVAVTDGGSGKSGSGDTIAITIKAPGGATVLATSGTLKGGNITIH